MRVPVNVDLTGLVVGQLSVTSLAPPNPERPGHRMWRCSCACGGAAIRSTGELMYAWRRGVDSGCVSCSAEVRRGFFAAVRKQNAVGFAGALARGGTLYSSLSLERLTTSIRGSIEEELGISLDPASPEPLLPARIQSFASGQTYGQDWSTLYPKRTRGRLFGCIDCGKVRGRGWACIECVAFVCVRCGRAERHRGHLGRNHLGWSEPEIRALFRKVEPLPLLRTKGRGDQAAGTIGFGKVRKGTSGQAVRA